MSHPFYGKGVKDELNAFLQEKVMCSFLKKYLIPVLCCTNSSTFLYLIASLNNFCTLLKWQKLFQNLFSARSFAPNHVLPTCSTFWHVECDVCQDRLLWELRFVVGDQWFFFISPKFLFLLKLCVLEYCCTPFRWFVIITTWLLCSVGGFFCIWIFSWNFFFL